MPQRYDYYVCIVANRITDTDFTTLVPQFTAWMERHTQLTYHVDVVRCDFDVSYKPFLKNKEGVEVWGLDGIKEKLRASGLIKPNFYHQILFVYEPQHVPNDIQLAAWTYPNPLYETEAFTETRYLEDDFIRPATHESIHAFFRLCSWAKPPILLPDTMDTFYKENEIDAPDGNRAVNLQTLSPYWNVVGSRLAVRYWTTFLQKLQVAIAAVKNSLPKSETIEGMIVRVCKEEGLSAQLSIELYATIGAESGFNLNAQNKNKDGTTDYGLCQLNSYWYIGPNQSVKTPAQALSNPELCVRVMARAFKAGRANDWIAHRSGAYKTYLPLAAPAPPE